MTTTTSPRLAAPPADAAAIARVPFARRLWDLITTPHAAITDPNAKRRARLASAILFNMIILFTAQMVTASARSAPIVLSTSVALVACYVLSRTRWNTLAVFAALTAIVVNLWLRVPFNLEIGLSYLATLVWFGPILVFSALLLTPGRAFLFSIGLIASVFILRPILAPNADRIETGVGVGFIMTIAVFVVLASYVQEYYLTRPKIAELQAADKRLREQNAALEATNREIRDFSYLVAHDLRAPLVNIDGYLDELRLSLNDLRPVIDAAVTDQPAARAAWARDIPEALTTIERSAQKMEALINEILKLARAGQRDFTPEAIDVDKLAREVLTAFAHVVREDNITVQIDPLPTVTADRLALQQMLTNLIDNAIKYRKADGGARLHVFAQQHPHETVIAVRDNGRGIAASELPRVFQPLRRASNVDEVRGEGMGLAYVQTLAARHGGRAWAESQEGRGSTFYVSIARTG